MTIKNEKKVKFEHVTNCVDTIRNPNIKDGTEIWKLVKNCQPLDLNSSYLYLLLCLHFSDTCLIAENDSRVVGFISSYKYPRNNDILFIWQIAVHESVRGQGLAKKLLHKLIKQEICQNVKYITFTISPTNKASKKLFNSFAKDLNVKLQKNVLYTKEFFPQEENHEEEISYQIGPLK